MKFSIDRDSLLDVLQRVQSVVEKKNAVQILSNILCSVEKDNLSICATDLEIGMKARLPIETGQEGRVTISAKQFLDIVKEIPTKAKITVLKKSNEWVEITSGKSKFSVVSLAADEFPPLPPFEEKEYFTARSEALIEMIDRTSFAVSTDATRYHLTGVYFEQIENHVMRMTATDGHRLSFVNQEVFQKMPEFKRGMIVPKKGLIELRRLLDHVPDSIELAFDRGYLYAHNQNLYLFVRLIEGEYPDVKQVIPDKLDHTVEIDRGVFQAALKRVSLLAHEKSKGVKFQFSKNSLVISSSNPDMGEAREELDIVFSGPDTEIGFNAKYILECLSVMDSENLSLSFKDKQSPGVVQGVDQRNHTYVIMPMRI